MHTTGFETEIKRTRVQTYEILLSLRIKSNLLKISSKNGQSTVAFKSIKIGNDLKE